MTSAPSLPSGTVTFLFTDIEDSSRLWDRHPIQMRVALERHDELLRSVIDANSGYVFTTAGDSFAAAFRTADAAAQTALDIQTAVSGEPWDDDTPIRVRIGIHSGEAHERDGDYFGPAVNRAARIESAGHGGQILVSGVTARVLAGSTVTDWVITDLGQHALKGLSDPEHIHQLGAAEFGPLRVAAAATTNLSGDPPELVGREGDIDTIEQLLNEHRLVTVTGVGGVGKTSIARAVAHRQLALVDEVWFVELAPVVDAVVVATTVSKTLGIAGGPGDLDEIATVLGRRDEILVVLDNCEHVLDTCADIAEALAAAPNVTILATSRLELEVTGEHVLRLGPLGVNEPSAELFVREARRRNPAFELTETERATVEKICAAVDGIPLAIELAAAKTRSLGPNEILDRLETVLGTAARRSRSDDRHATMTAAIDWSINLLDETTATGLGVLTVFAGSFDLEATDDVLGVAAPALNSVDTLDELVAHSLLEMTRTDIGVRYRLLEPVRQRASATLLADRAPARHAHLEHYLNRLERAYEALGTTSCDPLLSLIFDDLDNLRAVHNWALESDRLKDDLRLYRPLMISPFHDVFDPGDWAHEVLDINGVEAFPKWEDALACAVTVNFFTQDPRGRQNELTKTVRRQHDEGSTNPLMEYLVASRLTIYLDEPKRASAMFDHLETAADPFARFGSYFTGAAARRLAGEPTEAMSDRFRAGTDWARYIGATNFEAGIFEVAASHELQCAEYGTAAELAAQGEHLATLARMGFVRSRSREHQARALIESGGDLASAAALVRSILQEAVDSGGSQRTRFALATASLLFDALGDGSMAALATVPSFVGANLATTIDEEMMTAMRNRAQRESLDEYDIARILITELENMANVHSESQGLSG